MSTEIRIQENIRTVKHRLKTLKKIESSHIKHCEVVGWFQELCQTITDMIVSIADSHRKIKLKETYRNTLVFNLNQLLSYLFLVITIFETEYNIKHRLYEARSFVEKQLQYCISNIENTLVFKCSKILDPFGSFIKWVDTALCQLAEVHAIAISEQTQPQDSLENVKDLVEEILCHSMSIAQVTTDEDFMIIKGASQMVLESIESLTSELIKPNPSASMVMLYVDTCSDKLCALERKTNNAVLRLTLRVFSEFTEPLDNIHTFCLSSENKQKPGTFENLVADFDLHVDRIMQIGLFAISCSTNISRCIQIKSCMGNLEALESELVPAFNAAICETNSHNKLYATVLKEFWISRANLLKRHIFLIIDPFAFCQIIYDENKIILLKVQEAIEKNDERLLNISVEKFIDNSKVLQDFLSVVSDESQTEAKQIQEDYADFKKVIHEVKGAKEYFLNHPVDSKTQGYSRLLKRCKILLSITKKIWNCFVEEPSNGEDKQHSQVLGLTEEIVSNSFKTENPFLNHIISKGKSIIKGRDHSMLYQKNNIIDVMRASKKGVSTSLLKFLHTRQLSFNFGVKHGNTTNLQMTDILNELTTMSNSFDVS